MPKDSMPRHCVVPEWKACASDSAQVRSSGLSGRIERGGVVNRSLVLPALVDRGEDRPEVEGDIGIRLPSGESG